MIYEKGCIQAGEEWMERNLLAIASGAVGTAFAQVHIDGIKYISTIFHDTHRQITSTCKFIHLFSQSTLSSHD